MEFREAKKEDLNHIVEIIEQIQKLHEEARREIFKSKTREQIEQEVIELIDDEKEYVIVAVNDNEV